VNDWLKSKDSRGMDMESVDHPHPMLVAYDSRIGKKVFFYKDANYTDLMNLYIKAESRFTREELRQMPPTLIEKSSSEERYAGVNNMMYYRGVPIASVIKINPKYMNLNVLMHEMEHNLQHGRGQYTWDRDKSEKMAELRTLLRLDEDELPIAASSGYYYYHPEAENLYDLEVRKWKVLELMKKDRELVKNEVLKGKKLDKAVEEIFPKTEISKVHFSPSEEVDKYFQIKKGDRTIEQHIRTIKPIPSEKIVKDLKKEFGPDAEIYEWRDGKKVRMA
jgi:hypothetical protein